VEDLNHGRFFPLQSVDVVMLTVYLLALLRTAPTAQRFENPE